MRSGGHATPTEWGAFHGHACSRAIRARESAGRVCSGCIHLRSGRSRPCSGVIRGSSGLTRMCSGLTRLRSGLARERANLRRTSSGGTRYLVPAVAGSSSSRTGPFTVRCDRCFHSPFCFA